MNSIYGAALNTGLADQDPIRYAARHGWLLERRSHDVSLGRVYSSCSRHGNRSVTGARHVSGSRQSR